MQSKDYVPGVSGFKVDLKTGQVEINEGNVRVKAAASMITYAGPGQSNDQAAENIREALDDQQVATAAPFVVEAGRFFINGALVDDATISSKIAAEFSVWLSSAENGQSYVAGLGLGLADAAKSAAAAKSELTARVTGEKTEPTSDFDKAMAEGDAGKILDLLVGVISETSLAKDLTDPIPERIRQVIREELRPGGLLHRSNR